MVFDAINSASLSDQIYDILKRSIIERKMPASSKLDINALSQQLGVSRMPVIEALTRLETEGLVTRRNRVGTYVTPMDTQMFKDLFEARDMVEQWATRPSIERIVDADIEELRAVLATAQTYLDQDEEHFEYLSYTMFDHQFHFKLVSICGNARVTAMYASLNSHAQIARVFSLRALTRAREGQQEHHAILQAFAERDVDKAQQAQRLHLERSKVGIFALLDQHGVL